MVEAFSRCGVGLTDEIGGKALGLGLFTPQGLRIPAGFVLTASAYHHALEAGDIAGSISEVLDRGLAVRSSAAGEVGVFGWIGDGPDER